MARAKTRFAKANIRRYVGLNYAKHLHVELVDVVEEREVLVLGVDERLDELVDVVDACRRLDLLERLFETAKWIHQLV